MRQIKASAGQTSVKRYKKMQRAIFLLIVTFSAAALFGCSGVFCLSQVIRLPRDAQPTGKCIAVLNNHTSHQRLLELVEIFEKDGCNVYGYMEAIVKVIILDFTDVALQKVNIHVATKSTKVQTLGELRMRGSTN